MENNKITLKNIIQNQEASYKEILSQIPMRQKPVLFAIAKFTTDSSQRGFGGIIKIRSDIRNKLN